MPHYIIEFCNGSYWHKDVELTGRGCSRQEAGLFTSRYAAEQEANQWSLAGAMVIEVSEFGWDLNLGGVK